MVGTVTARAEQWVTTLPIEKAFAISFRAIVLRTGALHLFYRFSFDCWRC